MGSGTPIVAGRDGWRKVGSLSSHPLLLKMFTTRSDTTVRQRISPPVRAVGGKHGDAVPFLSHHRWEAHVAMIPVDKAEIGMVLASEVKDQKGRLLIPAGRELQERYLNALPMWGITQIEVEGEESDPEGDSLDTLEPWAVDRARGEVDRLFLRADVTHPVVARLHEIRLEGRARQIQKGGEHGHE